MRDFLARIRRIIFWLLPLAILGFILSKISLSRLYATVSDADPLMYVLGVACFPVTILVGAARWKLLIHQYWQVREAFGYVLRHYWIALSLSIFLPGQVGMDIYRVAVTSRRYGRYTPNVAILLEEKLLALIVCTSLVLAATPWLAIESQGGVVRSILDAAYAIVAACALAILFFAFMARSMTGQRIGAYIRGRVRQTSVSVLDKLKVDRGRLEPVPSPAELFRPVIRPEKLLPALLLSAASFLALAIGNQLFLMAVGIDLPFLASVFVISVLFFVVSIPISFAGLGVREGAYILLLGLFGVPPETALVIAVFALSGVLLNYLVGGAFILASSSSVRDVTTRAN